MKMDVWRYKSGEPPRSNENEAHPITEELRVAAVKAAALVRDINVLLSVANDSTDYHTKSKRLASAKAALSDLLGIVRAHSALSLTSLPAVEKGIADIESELLDYRMRPDGDGSLWVFHAGLYLRTPLNELLHHGLVEPGPQSQLPRIATPSSCSHWSLIVPSFRELGLDVDDPEHIVASDIGAIPVHGEPFLSFLMLFRDIIESGLPLNEIELGLNIFSGRDDFVFAVFEKLGPAKLMMRRAGIL